MAANWQRVNLAIDLGLIGLLIIAIKKRDRLMKKIAQEKAEKAEKAE